MCGLVCIAVVVVALWFGRSPTVFGSVSATIALAVAFALGLFFPLPRCLPKLHVSIASFVQSFFVLECHTSFSSQMTLMLRR